MAYRLARLRDTIPITDGDVPTPTFVRWWQAVVQAIEGHDATLANVTSGTWIPTTTNTLNIASSVPNSGRWLRVGNVVTASVTVGITPTAAGLAVLDFTLPVTSDFANDTDLSGTGAPITTAAGYDPGALYANFASNLATLSFMAPGATGLGWTLTFTYTVI